MTQRNVTIGEIQKKVGEHLQPQIDDIATVLRFMFNNLDFRVKTDIAQKEYQSVIKPILQKYDPQGTVSFDKIKEEYEKEL